MNDGKSKCLVQQAQFMTATLLGLFNHAEYVMCCPDKTHIYQSETIIYDVF